MSRAASRNNIMAGLFLVGALALGVVVSFILGDLGEVFLASRDRYVIRFPLNTGTTGLKPGSEVTLGGQKIGRVKKIELAFDDSEQGLIHGIDVHILVDARVRFREDATANLIVPLIGSISTINFAGVGGGAPAPGTASGAIASLIEPGGTIEGRLAPGLLAQAGIDEATIANVKNIVSNISQITDEVKPNIRPTFEEVRTFAEGLNERMERWDERVTSILASVDKAAVELEPTMLRGQDFIDEARAGLEDARRLIAANRGKIDRSLTNVESITERVRFETVDQIKDVMGQGKLALGEFTDLGEEANLILARESPKVSKSLDNVKDFTREANLMVTELRAQPWRVLKQPSKEDLEREPLYNAARSYAKAVGDLRAASEALDAIIAQVSADEKSAALIEPEALLGMRDWVEQAFVSYQQAEQDLLSKLVTTTP